MAGLQHGVVSVEQMRSAGVSDRMVERALAAGRVYRIHRCVYAIGHLPVTREARWMAAVLACGPDAVLSHRSAAALWGVREGEGRTDVAIAPGSGRRHPGLAIHRCLLHPDDRTQQRGIPVTSPARTLVDLTRAVGRHELERAVREAEYLRLLDPRAMAEALERCPRRLLARLVFGPTGTRSHLEDAFMRLLDRHGIPRPLTQVPVLGYTVDFLWPADRLIVELDGWEAHGTRSAFERDRAQSNELQLAGYLVLRITWRDVVERPAQTAARVRRALSP